MQYFTFWNVELPVVHVPESTLVSVSDLGRKLHNTTLNIIRCSSVRNWQNHQLCHYIET